MIRDAICSVGASEPFAKLELGSPTTDAKRLSTGKMVYKGRQPFISYPYTVYVSLALTGVTQGNG